MFLRDIFYPPAIDRALRLGARSYLSNSSGKDGQGTQRRLLSDPLYSTWKPFEVVYADLLEAVWPESLPHLQHLCAQDHLPLHIVRREKGEGSFLHHLDERIDATAGTGKPVWPWRQTRWCTSDLKRSPINTLLRTGGNLVISIEGIRAEEGEDRRKANPLTVREEITHEHWKKLTPEQALEAWCAYYLNASSKKRKVPPRLGLTWYPIFYWPLAWVWEVCGTSQEELDDRRKLYAEGLDLECADPRRAAQIKEDALDGWPCHPCYIYGNERCSCIFCVFGSKNDLRNGKRHHPILYQNYVSREDRTDCSFRPSFWLRDLAKEDSSQPVTSSCTGRCCL